MTNQVTTQLSEQSEAKVLLELDPALILSVGDIKRKELVLGLIRAAIYVRCRSINHALVKKGDVI